MAGRLFNAAGQSLDVLTNPGEEGLWLNSRKRRGGSNSKQAQVICISAVNKYDDNYKYVFITSSAALSRAGRCEQSRTCIKTSLQKRRATK